MCSVVAGQGMFLPLLSPVFLVDRFFLAELLCIAHKIDLSCFDVCLLRILPHQSAKLPGYGTKSVFDEHLCVMYRLLGHDHCFSLCLPTIVKAQVY